jgi:hypothetical protein
VLIFHLALSLGWIFDYFSHIFRVERRNAVNRNETVILRQREMEIQFVLRGI